MTLQNVRRFLPFLLILVPLLALGLSSPPAKAQSKGGMPVSFETVDKVMIEGNYYPSNKGKKATTVLILHDFDLVKGGSCRTEQIDDLASSLQEKGFAVLTFDFRGFGQSTQVKETFWTSSINQGIAHKSGTKGGPKTFTYKQFPRNTNYIRNLVNDVAAARNYMDNENDGGQLNSRSLVVIGAGQGATIGMMWMESEFKRFPALVRDLGPAVPPVVVKWEEESAGADFVCGIWLSIAGHLGNYQMPMNVYAANLGKNHKLPMYFIQGKEKLDPANDTALKCLNSIGNWDRSKGVFTNLAKEKDVESSPNKNKFSSNENLSLTGEKIINTELTGSKLLANEKVKEAIVGSEGYLDRMLQKPIPQWKERKVRENYYYWKLGSPTQPSSVQPILAKIKGDDLPQVVPPSAMNLR